jgi:hypothetical protein
MQDCDGRAKKVIIVVRRGARRAAIALAFGLAAAAVVTAAASPALAADDRVTVRAPHAFNAGGNPGSVTVSIAKRTKGCVGVRTGIGIALPGLRADQVQVQAFTGGQWQPVGVFATGGGIATGRTAPDRPVLCDRQETTARYRVAFAAGAPSGDAAIVGEAFTAAGALIGRDAAASTINGVRPTAPSKRKPSPSPSRSSPTPTPTVVTTTVAPFDDATTGTTPALAAAPGESAGNGGGLGGGTLIMLGGIGLVVVGAGLLVLLLLRARGERAAVPGAHRAGATTAFLPPVQAAPADAPTMIIPKAEDS